MDAGRRNSAWVLVAAAALGLAACSAGAQRPELPPVDPPRAAAATEGSQPATAAALPVAELRLALERHLGQHALLAAEAMRARVGGRPDADAAAAALRANARALTATVARASGPAVADTLAALWDRHLDDLGDHAAALAAGDPRAEQFAAALERHRLDIAAFVTTVGEPADAEAVAALVLEHAHRWAAAAEAYAEGGFAAAYQHQREAHPRLVLAAGRLAAAIGGRAPQRFTGRVDDTAVELRSLLSRQLSEHGALTIAVMRAGATGAADFTQAAAALNGNSRDLSATFASVYGRQVAQAFADRWAGHIGLLADYTVAAAGPDRAARDQARDRLRQHSRELAEFLSQATSGHVAQDAVAATLQAHVDQLASQADRYAAQDYAGAYTAAAQAHEHLHTAAAELAGGMAAHRPELFPG